MELDEPSNRQRLLHCAAVEALGVAAAAEVPPGCQLAALLPAAVEEGRTFVAAMQAARTDGTRILITM